MLLVIKDGPEKSEKKMRKSSKATRKEMYAEALECGVLLARGERSYGPRTAHCQSKVADLMFALELGTAHHPQAFH